MRARTKEILASAIAVSAVGYAVWPLGDVPWRWVIYLPESLSGDLPVLTLTLLFTAGVGFAIVAAAGVRLSNLAIGGVLAYVVWMTVLAVGISFHEPLLPIIAYGLVVVGVLLGAVAGERIDRRSSVANDNRPL